jgi:hypothetical protein
MIQGFAEFARNNQAMIVVLGTTAVVLTAVGGALTTFGFAASGAATAVSVLSAAAGALSTVLALPIAPALAIAAVVAGIIALFVDWRDTFRQFGSVFSAAWGAITSQIQQGDLAGAAGTVFDAVIALGLNATAQLIRAFSGFTQFVVSNFLGVFGLISPLADFINNQLGGAFETLASKAEASANRITNEMEAVKAAGQEAQAATSGQSSAASGPLTAPALTGGSDAISEVKKQEEALKALESQAKRVFEDTRTPAERYRAEVQKLDDLYANHLISTNTLRRAYAAAKEELYESSDAAKEHTDLQSQATSVIDSVKTAQERHAEGLGRLNTLYRQGYIDRETYNRALDEADDKLRDSNEGVRRAEEIFNSTRTAAERFEDKFRELRDLASDGLISRDTFDRAVRDAERQRDLAIAQEGGQETAARIPTASAIFGGARAGQIFGASDTIAKQQLTVQQQMLDETKRTRQAIERRGLVFN